MIGRTVGHYRILERLGGGGMGIVYKAEDTKLDRAVALKFLPNDLTRDDVAKKRFLVEARAAAKLDHPNICTVFEVGETDDGETFIAMAYYDGESLAARLERGPLPVDDAVRIATAVARGLGKAHSAGIIHRDIKPANIMLTTEGEVKVVDFGIAKLGGATVTRTSSSPGTLAYMAPEQIQGEPVTPATDLWSLGVVLQEMLTGSRPFRGDFAQAVAYAILHEEPKPLGDMDRPAAIDTVLAKALTKEPSRRWQTAAELIEALETVSGTRASAGPDRHSRVRRIALPVALLAAAVVVIGSWLWKQRGADMSGPKVDAPRTEATATARTVDELDPKQVAVTPFANRTGDASLDPVGTLASDWITDELMRIDIHALTRQQLEEVAASLAKDTSGTSSDPDIALAKATGSGLLVTGEYFANGPTLTIRMKVIDTATLEALAVLDPVEGPRSNPSDVVADAGRLVRDSLAVRLIRVYPGEPDRLLLSRPPTYEAYAEMVLSLEAAKIPDYKKAIVHAKRAVEIDPDFADAWLTLSIFHYYRSELRDAKDALAHAEAFRSELPPVMRLELDGAAALLSGRYETAIASHRDFLRRMPGESAVTWKLMNFLLLTGRVAETLEVATRKEIRILLVPDDPNSLRHWYRTVSSAHAILGDHERELEVARAFRAILPADFHGHVMEARALAALGRFDELNRLIDESLAKQGELQRALWVVSSATSVLQAHGYREESRELSERAIATIHALAPDQQAKFQETLAGHSYGTGKWDDAERILTALAKDPADKKQEPRYLAQLGVIAAARGDRRRALEMSEKLKALHDPEELGTTTWRRSRIAGALGDQQEAVDLLKQAFSEGWTGWPYFYQVILAEDPAFESLRGYPPFEEMLKSK